MRKREKVANVWPILPGSEKPPADWQGWPEGKRFAVVLTHDVEGPLGLEHCQELAQLETQHGFKSCFNFIPEGDYTASESLRNDLVSRGFEIGVHDLRHDGKLYRSRAEFVRNASKINSYLKQWGAVGFRSGFMLHNLEWLHHLGITYDASTFDTDPFEPQPQGKETIFPFWVPRKPRSVDAEIRGADDGFGLFDGFSSNQGYVELPYTLPQDSTLFMLLRERHPDIWFQKVDWIARNGGMVLLDTHPDYMEFGQTQWVRPLGGFRAPKRYPFELYSRFLTYLRTKYRNEYWHALPKEVASFWQRRVPQLITS